MKNKQIFILIFALLLILISASPTYAKTSIEQARTAFYERNYKQAEELFLELNNEENYQWETNFFLGMIYLRTDELQKAVDYMEEAYKLTPEDYYTLVNYARILYRSKNYQAAREKLDEVSADQRNNDEQYNNLLGLLELEDDNLKKAVDFFEQALEINPENYYVQNNLGLTLISQGDFQKAKQHLKKAVAQKPTEAYIYNNLGICQENLNQLQQAKESYEQALELNPDHKKAEVNLNRVLSKINNQ
ncbi:MAG: tetratricopeptide repeat protein [bacterium]